MTTIWVTFTHVGWHRWKNAKGVRSYLKQRHRHLFHFRVTVPVTHYDRDIEFHDLQDIAKQVLPVDGEFGDKSCETIARDMGEYLRHYYGLSWVEVSVSEDNEVGAIVKVEA